MTASRDGNPGAPFLAAGAAVGTQSGQPTLRAFMDDKTINLWRQIESGRRRAPKPSPPGKAIPKPINDN